MDNAPRTNFGQTSADRADDLLELLRLCVIQVHGTLDRSMFGARRDPLAMMTRFLLNPMLPTMLVASLVFGCDGDDKKAEKKPDPDVAEENVAIKVELPPTPDFDEGKVADKWEDGSWSIYGLRKTLEENVKEGDAGKVIEVRGYVQEIYEPPECPEGETCPPSKHPHIWITDKPSEKGKKRAMMVVSYSFTIPEYDVKRWKDVPDVTFSKGEQYTFRGKFRRFSDQGFADARGLLEFQSYKVADPETGETRWVAPPGSPWHPLEIARQEEEQKALIDKVNKDAVKKKGG